MFTPFISISLEKREENINDNHKFTNETAIENYSQIDFVELCSSNYGLMSELSDNDASQSALLYRNTSKTFNSICDNIVSTCENITPKTESKLTMCLKKTLQYNSNIAKFLKNSDEYYNIGSLVLNSRNYIPKINKQDKFYINHAITCFTFW